MTSLFLDAGLIDPVGEPGTNHYMACMNYAYMSCYCYFGRIFQQIDFHLKNRYPSLNAVSS